MKNIIFIFFSFLFFVSLSQNEDEKFDIEYKGRISDSAKIETLLKYSAKYSYDNFNRSFNLALQALNLADKIDDVKRKIKAYSMIADAYWANSNYKKANEYYFISYKLSDSIKDEQGIAFALYNLGWVTCITQHNYSQINYLYTSLTIYQRLKDTLGLMYANNAIGTTYLTMYSKKKQIQDFDSSLKYLYSGYCIARLKKVRKQIPIFAINLGELYSYNNNAPLAMHYTEISKNYYALEKDSNSVVLCLNNEALYLTNDGKQDRAAKLYDFIYNYTAKHQLAEIRMDAALALSNYFKSKNQPDKSFKYLEQYCALKDTLSKQIYSTELQSLQYNFDFDKKNADILDLTRKNEIQELKNNKNKLYISLLFAIAAIVITAAIFLFRQNQQKNKANNLLKYQNQIISHKKKDIENSIEYAKGIQDSFLPEESDLKKYFKESFIYYKPKDVVSGDFYWFNAINDQEVIVVAADCTGHGVPGALMSIVGINTLNKIINERKNFEPALILKELNNEIKNTLKQNNTLTKQRDGMDVALVKINKATKEICFAAANRSLIIINENNLMEYKTERFSIGGYTEYDTEFGQQKITYKTNDMLYIFTDGFTDQFGGQKGKKFMTKNLKELFMSINSLNMKEKIKYIDSTFIEWKGYHEQVDDICVIGIKLLD